MITYIDFINRLEDLDIKLYDFQKRISFFRLSNLNTEKINQTGGSQSNSIIYKVDKPQLENIILKLLAKEYNSANILCDHFCSNK
jgi:hypothetical protein